MAHEYAQLETAVTEQSEKQLRMLQIRNPRNGNSPRASVREYKLKISLLLLPSLSKDRETETETDRDGHHQQVLTALGKHGAGIDYLRDYGLPPCPACVSGVG